MTSLSLGLGLPDIVGRGATAWSPLDLGSALLEWWSPDVGITQSGGGSVSAWAGVKNGYTVSQQLGSARPQFSADGFNGRSCVVFDGLADCLFNVSAAGWFPTGSEPMELHGVVQQDAVAASDTAPRCAVALGNSSFNTDMRGRRVVSSGVNRFAGVVGSDPVGVSRRVDTVDLSGRHAFSVVADSSEMSSIVDNESPETAAVVKNVAAEQFAIGSLPNGTAQFWLGRIRHVIVTGSLSADQRSLLTSFLLAERAA